MELSALRAEIDGIDSQLIELFVRRMEVSEEIAACKQQAGLPVLNKEREREVLNSVSEAAGPYRLYAGRLFSTLMTLSKARQGEYLQRDSELQRRVIEARNTSSACFPRTGRIACQGVEGGNSQAACDQLFPQGNLLYVKSFQAVFEAVRAGLCDFGVVPLENSLNGSVRAVYELLQQSDCSIVRTLRLSINHALLAKPGTSLEQIHTIYSHEQALGQCSGYLSGTTAKAVSCANTAVAAKLVSESDDAGIAAIASPGCASLYGLSVLAEGIQDYARNDTLFACIAPKPMVYDGANRIALMLSCSNTPGALCDLLSAIAATGINLSKLESCPAAGTNFEYFFLLELEASLHDPQVLSLLTQMEQSCDMLRFLGAYAQL